MQGAEDKQGMAPAVMGQVVMVAALLMVMLMRMNKALVGVGVWCLVGAGAEEPGAIVVDTMAAVAGGKWQVVAAAAAGRVGGAVGAEGDAMGSVRAG